MKPQEDRAALVDEYGKLSTEIQAFKPKVDRHKQLSEQIQAWFVGKPAAAEFIEQGREYSVVVGARGPKRTIFAMAKLAAYLGIRKFYELCSFTLENFDDHVPVPDRSKFVKKELTGSRKLKAIAKAGSKAA